MHIELYPIVCWLTQDTGQSYEESLDEILVSFRDAADRYLGRYCPANRRGYDAISVIYLVLQSLQDRILDQYLPLLEPDRTKAVSCVWPRWEETGMAVKLKSGRIARLEPPLPADQELQTRSCDDGFLYKFTFYRNDKPEQRRRWVHHELRELLRNERESEQTRRETPADDSSPGMAAPPSFEKTAEEDDFLQKLRRMDPEDFAIAMSERAGEDAAGRKRRQRATEKVFAAAQILMRSGRDPVAETYRDRLQEAADLKERKKTLTEYFSRFCQERWRKIREAAK